MLQWYVLWWCAQCLTFPWLDLDHLERLGTGHNAPETPRAEMDAAAVVCTPAVCPNVPLSVAASTPTFAWLYEQAGASPLLKLWERDLGAALYSW